MSGHNKWSKIKHKKAVSDAQKSRVFSRYSKLITTEAKRCGGDKDSPSLRTILEKARGENMPNENIDRAIKKAVEGGEEMNEVIFEMYGPGGVAIIIVALTDNNNRTSNELKAILSKNNLSLAQIGSVAWAFNREQISRDFIPNTIIEVSDEDKMRLDEFLQKLNEQDDIVSVYTNINREEGSTD